jgi:RNA-directed DNA polymerase
MFAAEHVALDWFYSQLKFKQPTRLYSLIAYARERGPNKFYYHYWHREEGSEHGRLIMAPETPMMVIHHLIKDFLMGEFDRKPWSYGFMGGSCEEAAHAHKHHSSFLRFDIRNAFFQVSHERVLESLSREAVFGTRHYGTISKWVARFIADLCTAQAWPEIKKRYRCVTFLPQGSPTSPILFDIACDRFDDRMMNIACRVNGKYTRYADNIVFSMPDKNFPPKVRRAILHDTRGYFPFHKVSQSNCGEPFRMLGLQIANHQVRMTRSYKRKLKGALYHLNYGAECGIADERSSQIARGLMSFAILDDLPLGTLEEFIENCKQH